MLSMQYVFLFSSSIAPDDHGVKLVELGTAHLGDTSAARNVSGDQVLHSCVDVELRLVKLLGQSLD